MGDDKLSFEDFLDDFEKWVAFQPADELATLRLTMFANWKKRVLAQRISPGSGPTVPS